VTDKPAAPNVEHAFDPAKQDELEEAIKQLSPDEAAFFVAKLELSLKKRKLQLTGYLVAMFVWLIGMVFALAYYGIADGFVGWVFLVPFALLGGVLYAFGKWADRVGSANPSPAPPSKR
jgi:hypothetical protein